MEGRNVANSIKGFIAGNRSIVAGATWLFALRGLQLLLSFAGIFFLTRSLSVETYGALATFLAVLGICSMTSLPGINQAVAQCAARDEVVAFYSRAVVISISASLVGSLILICASIYASYRMPQLEVPFLVASALLPLSHGMLQWQALLLGRERYDKLFAYSGVGSFLTYGVMIVALQFYPDILVPVLCMLAIPALINLAMTFGSFVPTSGDRGSTEIRYGIRTSGYLAINAIANNVDKLLITAFLPLEAVAYYALSERIAEITKNATQDLATALAPRLARVSVYTKRLDKKLRLLALSVSIAIIAATFTVFPYVFLALFTTKYDNAVPIAQALLVTVSIGVHATLRARYLWSKLDLEGARDVYVYTSILRVAVSAALVPAFGLWGAVASTLLYRIATSVFVDRALARRHLNADAPLAQSRE